MLRFETLESRHLLSSTPLYALNVGGPTVEADGLTWRSDDEVIVGVTTNFAAAYAFDTDQTNEETDTADPSVSFTGRSDSLLDQAGLTLDPRDYTAPDEVFRSWRNDHRGGEDLRYRFAVSPGKHRVDLYFAEPSKDAAGERVFDLRIEGATVLGSFDLYAESGGLLRAMGRSFVVDSDAMLDVELVNGDGVAILSAVRVSTTNSDVDLSFNPSTLTAASLNQIQRGDVVVFQPGSYTLSQAELDALLDNSSQQRKDITLRGVPGQTHFDYRGQTDTEWIELNRWVQGHDHHYTGVTIDGLTFLNAGLATNRTHDFVLRNTIFDGFEDKTHSSSDRVAVVWASDDVTVDNNYLRWNNTSTNINALGVGDSENAVIVNNKVEGLLRKAVQFWKSTNGLLAHNDIERWSQTPGSGMGEFEDHGYYIHVSDNIQILSNKARGWSDTAAGNSVKIKNVRQIEVAHNTFDTSGIIGRLGAPEEGEQIFEHIWIHDNVIDGGQINIWTPDVNPTAVRIEGNTVLQGGITATRSVIPELFNQTVDLGGGLAGGVYSNAAVSYTLAAGIHQAGNTVLGASSAQEATETSGIGTLSAHLLDSGSSLRDASVRTYPVVISTTNDPPDRKLLLVSSGQSRADQSEHDPAYDSAFEGWDPHDEYTSETLANLFPAEDAF